MVSYLDRKLWRDLRRIQGQAFAVALVMACGLAMMITTRSLIYSLESTRSEYYEASRFADVFVNLKRAANSLAEQAARIRGVGAVESAISERVTLDIPGLNEPASGLVLSFPDQGAPELNRLFLRTGRMFAPETRGEVLVSEPFAEANHLGPGASIVMLLNGKRQALRVAGIVLSPEFVFESRPGVALPDHRTYGVFWMRRKELARAFDLDGAFNELALKLAPGALEQPVISQLDKLLVPFGGRGAYGRSDHPSHVRLSDEISVLRLLSIGFPVIFLTVGTFMTNAVLSRLLTLQREQIAILKAFGFRNGQIVVHYLKFAVVMVAGGMVIGTLGCLVLGRQMLVLYHRFFRFPELSFHLEYAAFLMAIGVSAAAAVIGVFNSVRNAARLPPAEAMRPAPPANYRPALVERTGIGRFLSHTFRIAARNLQRRPAQALLTITGLALATGILIVPNCIRDGVNEVMDFQWDTVQRQTLSLGLVEPDSANVAYEMAHLPGVLSIEPVRAAFVRLSHDQRQRQLQIQGLPAVGRLTRVLGKDGHQLTLPDEGLIISAKLAEILGARVGDQLLVQELEGKRVSFTLKLVGLADDFAGVAAYMDMNALNRALGEGQVISGASLDVDSAYRDEFLSALKGIPRISWVAIKESLRENFRQSTAANIGVLQSIYLSFALIVAFGVIYNNARISLAERARELATMRVIGFSRREVGGVLVTELVLLALAAVPVGLLLGTGFASGIIHQVNTETVRLPLVLTANNYAFAVLVVTVASFISALVVLGKMNQLDLVSALKAPE